MCGCGCGCGPAAVYGGAWWRGRGRLARGVGGGGGRAGLSGGTANGLGGAVGCGVLLGRFLWLLRVRLPRSFVAVAVRVARGVAAPRYRLFEMVPLGTPPL